MICPNCSQELNQSIKKDSNRKTFYWCHHCQKFEAPQSNLKIENFKIKKTQVEVERIKGKFKKVDWIGKGKGK